MTVNVIFGGNKQRRNIEVLLNPTGKHLDFLTCFVHLCNLFSSEINKWKYRVQTDFYVRNSVPFNIDKNENDYNETETLMLRDFIYTWSVAKGRGIINEEK